MINFEKLDLTLSPRRYALIEIKEQTKLACYVNNEWIIDATCTSINEMLNNGLVCKESIQCWISNQCFSYH